MNVIPNTIQARERIKRLWRLVGVVVVAVHALLLISTFRDYGMSWDQPSSADYGESVWRFYATLGKDRTAVTHSLHAYGGFFEIVTVGVRKLCGFSWIEARNLSSACLAILGVVCVWRFSARLFGERVGAVAALFLGTTPVYYGHSFINPKDIPFAVFYMTTLLLICRLWVPDGRRGWQAALVIGISWGLCLAVRVGGLILLPLIVIAWFAPHMRSSGRSASARNVSRFQLAPLALLGGVAWTVMVMFWPFACQHPFSAALVASREFAHYPWTGTIFFAGKLLHPWELPWWYVPKLLLWTLPEHVIAGVASLAAFSVLAAVKSKQDPILFERVMILATITYASLLPFVAVEALGSTLYDGYRHLIFIVPPLIVLSAVGLEWLLCWAKSAGGDGLQAVFAAVVAGMVMVTCADMRALHPYEYIYFNRVVAGGLEQANRAYDLDYWGTALAEAAKWVGKHYEPQGVNPVYYTSDAAPQQVDEYLPKNSVSGASFVRVTDGFRLIFMIRRRRQDEQPTSGRIVYVVQRMGVPLVDVVECP